MDSWFFLSFPFPADFGNADLEEAKNLAGREREDPRLIQIRLAKVNLQEITPACQGSSLHVVTAASSSRNAVSISSEWTTNRFPPLRWASTTKKLCSIRKTSKTNS
jgi:hypothetical protein